MRARQGPASPLCQKIRFALTDHPITAWAWARLLRVSLWLIALRVSETIAKRNEFVVQRTAVRRGRARI